MIRRPGLPRRSHPSGPMRPSRRLRGISLIEALVALAVTGIGVVSYIGVQNALRLNADVAKQRAEAVRIAQESVEAWRAYERLPAAAGATTYADVATQPPVAVAGAATNTSFQLARTVDGMPGTELKNVVTDVGWVDRTGAGQNVRLSTLIAGVEPALPATTGVPPDGAGGGARPLNRHPAVPLTAVGTGATSTYRPPQAPSGQVTWVFDNLTGVITSVCDPACTPVNALLLSGFVRFATGPVQPTGLDAEVPPSPMPPLLPVAVEVARTYPSNLNVGCFGEQRPLELHYVCAVPVNGADQPPRWSGRAELQGLALATNIADADPGKVRVCRYTSTRSHAALPNDEHPLDYTDVAGALRSQNFLVILAGDGTMAFDCPDDDASTPLVSGRTWHHQPAS